MLFNKKVKPGDYQILREGEEEVMWINYNNYPSSPSLEDSPICMARTIDFVIQNPGIVKIIFSQMGKNYEYNYDQTGMLLEIATIYNHFMKQKKILTLASMGSSLECMSCYPSRLSNVQYILLNLLRSDPIGAYVELKRMIREETVLLKKTTIPKCINCREHFINLLRTVTVFLDQTKLIEMARPYLPGQVLGNREIYRSIFRPIITPDFMYTRLMIDPPLDGEILDSYSVDEKTEVNIYRTSKDIKMLYHLNPPEFKLSEDKFILLNLARSVLSEHKPKSEEFIDPERMRKTFFNVGKDLITELATSKGVNLDYQEIQEMANILVRYTVGFGLMEILLNDKKIQDISINSPMGQSPIFLVHADYGECVTNIIPSADDGESWATKFRLISGRPLDEANPILDTELILPGSRNRVAIITRPLNPYGLAFAFRRHRDKPWTLPLFIKNKMINPLAAGVLSFLIDGSRTLLIAGTRGSGKTSLLDSCLIEIMRKYRIITIEDTMELSTEKLRELGYNIQPMKVRAALAGGGSEIPADEGIRTSLRLGDSSLIIGEIRSLEALALYEAMRVGALANVVAGTIHGDSPYGVFDRVVNDLKVPRTSFKATDIIVVCNPIKSSDGLHSIRRVTRITEVRKIWENDPILEGGFVDLMIYNPKTDTLEPTQELINGDSEIIKAIAGSVKDWAGSWDAVWENILLRAKIKETLVNYAEKFELPEILEAKDVVQFNDMFHKISEEVKEQTGVLDNKKIFMKWEQELNRYVKLKKLEARGE